MPNTNEVVLHELGESLAVSFATVQNELARYPNEIGTFLLDEVEVTIPVSLRVDDLGQVIARTVDPPADNAPSTTRPEVGQVRWRIRPVMGTSQTVPLLATEQPLTALLTEEERESAMPTIKRLEEQRIFSIGDLLRVTRNLAGQRAVARFLDIQPEGLQPYLERAMLFVIPDIAPLAATLVKAKITSLRTLAEHKNDESDESLRLITALNDDLPGRLEKSLTAEDIKRLQVAARRALHIRLESESK